MKPTIRNLWFSSVLAAALAAIPSVYGAESPAKAPEKAPGQTKENPASENSKGKREWYPFSGIVGSVDNQAKTISLKKKDGERVVKMDAKSKLEVHGKPAILSDVKPGDYAHGTLHKDAAGIEVIMSAKFDKEGPKKGKEGAEKETQKAPSAKHAQ
jgi:hypothetical protein